MSDKPNFWLDGICKRCGSLVLETDARGDINEEIGADYKNTCLDPTCVEHRWHYVGDMEELGYYEHDPRINEKISFLKQGY